MPEPAPRPTIPTLTPTVRTLHEQESLRAVDAYFAQFAAHLGGGGEALQLAAALVCNALADGHICLDLAACAGTRFSEYPYFCFSSSPRICWWSTWRASSSPG